MGERAAIEVSPLAAIADREPPRLAGGNCIEYHPAYRDMERIAYGSGMVATKYSKHEHSADAPFVGFALGYLFGMAEMGLYCPLCMTDGVAHVLTKFGTRDQIDRVVPHLASTDLASLWTGAMFLTEKAGGSDVGANETVFRGGRLSGQKWFCSNADAHAVLVTARPEGAPSGIKGIRTYLLLTRGNPGVRIDRLKPKLGVRSMPTGEITLTDAPAEEIGDFHAIAEMLNLSRLYNAVASVAVIGRAIHEARWYIERRSAFGRRVIDFPLAQETLRDLEAEHLGALLLTFDAVDAFRRGNTAKLRLLTPIVKAVAGKLAVPCVSECMELIGGNAYIEDSPLPRLLRDAQVLPIWEGTTNILVLDALRVAGENAGERDARRWMDQFARDAEINLLRDAGEDAAAERLAARPLGLIPGAKLPSQRAR